MSNQERHSPRPRYYERLWKCGVCDTPLFYDPWSNIVFCGCGIIEKPYIAAHSLRLNFRMLPADYFNAESVKHGIISQAVWKRISEAKP